VAAVNDTLRDLLRDDERTLIFGEDVEDRKGGVFGLTKGLSTMFPGRVVNSPLAEATIAGTAAGLAIAGWKPIFELQFIDFVGPAFNQIVNQIATLRWRSAGAWECPLILMAPCGGFFSGGGPWHTQTNESWFAHAPGIRVVMPSTPGDAAALLRAAAAGRDPVLFMIPKHLLRQRHSDAAGAPAAIGRAAIRRQGEHVTVVAWGNCVDIAMEAARTAAPRGVSAEVIDLRSIVPCDWDTINASVRCTHRLVVVQEDARTASIGQASVAEVTMQCWKSLACPPILIARPDVHVPFEPALWQSLLPSQASVLDAITETARMEDTPCACTR
jgi:2-oxoisovalerate dehydrogenase E1 component